jgi:hypothetical protein
MPAHAPKRTKIVCTIGPASKDVNTLYKMGQAGMDIARMNFSHGTYDDHRTIFKHLGLAGKRLGKPFGVLQDLQGPKIRVGDLPKEGVKLVTGHRVIFGTGSSIASGVIPVTLDSLHRDVKKGERLLLDDGLLEVEVERVDGRHIYTQVIQGGLLTSHKGLNLPGTKLQLPDRFQRRAVTAARIEIEPERFRELELRDAVIVLGRDQERILVRKRHLRLEDVEAGHRAGLESILLILKLALEEVDRFFLHVDQLAIQEDLVELLFYRRDHRIDSVAEPVVTAVTREICGANGSNDAAAGKNHLRRRDRKTVLRGDPGKTATRSR